MDRQPAIQAARSSGGRLSGRQLRAASELPSVHVTPASCRADEFDVTAQLHLYRPLASSARDWDGSLQISLSAAAELIAGWLTPPAAEPGPGQRSSASGRRFST